MTQEYRHTPVLLKACLEYTQPETKHIFVDATLGGAGHSVEVARRLGASFGTPAAEGLLIGIDQDEEALVAAKARLEAVSAQERAEFRLLRGNFGDLDALLESVPVPGIDAILFDLGVSSHQIDDTSRGFSFKEEAPLDMRMDPGKQTLTAAEIINTYNAADLTRIIRDFSDEKWAARIASFVCEARAKAPIETSGQLVEIIKAAIPASARREGGHPAKRTFQALRIEVNDELGVLARGLEAAVRWLNPGGRMAVISYHSLEDRIVKDLFARMANRCTCPPDLPVCVCGKPPVLRVITRKPCVPSATEIDENPRARSAKLRVAEKCE
ncbi:MAG: 16S rRNA (cytosine(1402)-N(4))-methyltransferase RsmH [Eggerthellaceae bacterium]|nr:16S rRNA (cytosine(1402)-N(4))-methyltransferase RsmH [Eggerthellaceae bacterium]